jgi:lipid biosynthesis B12-binding/radical SAM protein
MGGELTRNRRATCLIVSANQVVTPYPVYPIGAAYVVGALRRSGHKVHHFDLLADGGFSALMGFLQGKKYDFVGVSIRNLDTVDSADPKEYLQDILTTVRGIREKLDTVLVLGGPAFSIMPEKLLEFLQADYGVVGEGEVVVPWLAAELAAGRRPREKLFFASPLEGEWYPSDLSDSTVRYYTEHGGMLNVQTKRGCPYSCSYCSYPTIEGKTLRYRDPEDVAEEVVHLQRESGARYLFFTDSFFNDSEGRFLQVAEALVRRKNSLPWCAFFRPRDLKRDELRLLKRAGLAAMELGTDGASDRTLAGIGKNFSFSDVLRVHRRVVAEEIPCAHFIMFGCPGEDEKSMKEGLANIEKLQRSVVFAFIGIRILPGTGIYDRAVTDGIITGSESLLTPQYYYSPHISRERMEEMLLDSFEGRMDRIYPCHEFEERIAMLHDMGHAGPLWDLLLTKGRR